MFYLIKHARYDDVCNQMNDSDYIRFDRSRWKFVQVGWIT